MMPHDVSEAEGNYCACCSAPIGGEGPGICDDCDQWITEQVAIERGDHIQEK